MDIVSNILKLFFGSKEKKDKAEIQPYVDLILKEYVQLSSLSHDELRAKTDILRQEISTELSDIELSICALKTFLSLSLTEDNLQTLFLLLNTNRPKEEQLTILQKELSQLPDNLHVDIEKQLQELENIDHQNTLAYSEQLTSIKTLLESIQESTPLGESLKTLNNIQLEHQLSKDLEHNYVKVCKEYLPNKELPQQFYLENCTKTLRHYFSQSPSSVIDFLETCSTALETLQKELDKKIEAVLDRKLPVAFAIMKETARRFTEFSEVEVTATEFDRYLATEKDFVTIQGDKAIYKNEWSAGGNVIQWNMVHYDVQLFGGVVLHKGKIAEMATGEGKTLVATLPVFLNALAGKGVHIVTVNDYLARRDSEWMGTLYMFHGLSVDCIDNHEPNSEERRQAYRADITFGTNNEFGFDYLRDNMCTSSEELVQRKHHYAIVDEVDSILIDDARTPLIISGQVSRSGTDDELFVQYRPLVEKLFKQQREHANNFLIEAKKLIGEGKKKEGGLALLRAHKCLPKYKPLIKFLSEEGMKALLLNTENDYMKDNNREMHIVTNELYFVIDEKMNSVDLMDKGIELLSKQVGEEDFFVLPSIGDEIAKLEKSDLSAQEKALKKEELLSDYSVKSERLHTIQQLLKAYAMFEKDTEYVVINNKVMIVDEQTGRILDGRRYSDGLHQAIEAKENVKVEASSQTCATITLQNYFRMYAKLAGMTGTAETEAGEFWSIYKLDVVVIPTNRPISRVDEPDYVYKTKREKYKAVIDEIIRLVELGRPVLVGTTSVEISEQLSKMLTLRKIKHNVLNAKQHQREADIVAEAGRAGIVTIATNMAGRGTDIKLSPEVVAAGGLAIIGTERHESRRVDRQLRGRAGRQGDPGTSVFFVSLEDHLMRLFGSNRIAVVMDRLGHKEGEYIQHGMISRSIERAQKKVEENHFGTRKRLLEYDDVMNAQREVIYTRRKNALSGERIEIDINNMIHDYVGILFDQYYGQASWEELQEKLIVDLSLEIPFSEKEWTDTPKKILAQQLIEAILDKYFLRVEQLVAKAHRITRQIYLDNKATLTGNEKMGVPLSDGKHTYNLPVNVIKAYETGSHEIVKTFVKVMILIKIDDLWKEHLREMDDLKQAANNASYEQKDPLLIYKLESYKLFEEMIETANRSILSSLLRMEVLVRDTRAPQRTISSVPGRAVNAKAERGSLATATNSTAEPQKQMPVKVEKKVGRNEECPCGSGKKYKACHGKTL